MVIWIIGMSGAGKSVIGENLSGMMRERFPQTVFIDGDGVRELFGNDLGYTIRERKINADRICRMCRFLDKQELHVVCSVLSLFHESQDWNRRNLSGYFEVYMDAPMDLLAQRDAKGLYQKAKSGKEKNVVGVDIPFVPPKKPDMIIKNCFQEPPEKLAKMIYDRILPGLESKAVPRESGDRKRTR